MFGITKKNAGEDGEGTSSVTPSPLSQSPSSSSLIKRKRPGPASKTMKRRKPEENGQGTQDKSGASSQEELKSPSTLVQDEGKCFMCFKPANPKGEWGAEEKGNKVLKNFCEVMMIREEDDFPKSPFCADCEENLQGLWGVEKILQDAGQKKAELVSGIARKVLASDEEKVELLFAARAGPWMKWRKSIVEGCRRKLHAGDSSLAEHRKSDESDVTFHSAPTTPRDEEDFKTKKNVDNSKAEAADDKDEAKKLSGDETLDAYGLQSDENSSAVSGVLQEEEELNVEPMDIDEDTQSGTDLRNSSSDREQSENASGLALNVGASSVLSSSGKEQVGDNKENQEGTIKTSAAAQQEDYVEQPIQLENIRSVQLQIKKEEPEEKCSEQAENDDQFSFPATPSVQNRGGSTGSGGLKPNIETPSLSVPRKVNVARKRTGGSYPTKITGNSYPRGSGSGDRSQNSSLKIDEGESSFKASDFPYRVPENPKFMIAPEKMSPITMKNAKKIIFDLGGTISSSSKNSEFDPDCVAIIAERLSSSEQIICSIAAGMFCLKKDYLEACQLAGRFVSIKKKYLWSEEDAKQTDKEEKKLAKASYNWTMAQRSKGKKGAMYGKKFFLLPTTEKKLEVSRRMIRAAGGELVEAREEATMIIKDGSPPKKNKGNVPIKNSSHLYTMIVADPPK